jgi:hypothetical protein
MLHSILSLRKNKYEKLVRLTESIDRYTSDINVTKYYFFEYFIKGWVENEKYEYSRIH